MSLPAPFYERDVARMSEPQRVRGPLRLSPQPALWSESWLDKA